VDGLQDPGEAEFTKLIAGFDLATDAWEKATATSNYSMYMSMLIPAANAQDVIEAAGGPHFGNNGDTNPQYYTLNDDGTVVIQSVAMLNAMPTSVYSLIPEQMDESYWYNLYGAGSVPSTLADPSSNEHVYRSENVLVDHYLASGGLVVDAAATGTARGFSGAEAYQYALDWIANNGGLPADAALTYAGDETVTPNATAPTSDQPYPATRLYKFVWRHVSSAILTNDKIEIDVDDAGALTTKTVTIEVLSPHCNCLVTETETEHVPPWIPVYHLNTYVRIWRSLGTPLAPYSGTQPASESTFAYCGSDMTAVTSQAQPCAVTATSGGLEYADPMSGTVLSASESLVLPI